MDKDKEKKEIKQIVTGKVKDKTLIERAGNIFLSEDTRTVKEYVFWDVLLPTLKNGIADVIIGAIEMALFGSARGRRTSSSLRRDTGNINYGGFSNNSRRNGSYNRVDNGNRSSRYDFNDIVLDSRGDAEEVIASMEEIVREYGEATVADLNSLVGVTGKFIDNKWGWTDCRDFHVSRLGRGYVLDFNPPIYLD